MTPGEEVGVRKLAAIMFTDIKGFSKKMGENETIAMALLKAHDTMMNELFEKYDGKVIKSIGDSFMVDFSSAVNAVKCAIETQEIFWYYNKGKSELEKIEIRIGIHLGDVISDGRDIFGDGVNVAARIEAMTSPNRICISQDIYNQIRNKMDVHTYSLGLVNFKNIADSVEVYEILIDSIPELSEPSRPREDVPSPEKIEKSTKLEALRTTRKEPDKKPDPRQQKIDKEKEEKLKRHYDRANELFATGKIDEAETELAEVFKVVALHAQAQLLQMQIEEERFRREEQGRLESLRVERKKVAERARRVEELLEKGRSLLEQDKYVEALAAVNEIYPINPSNQDAKELERRIREAERLRIALQEAETIAARSRTDETVPVRKKMEVRIQTIKRWESRQKRKRFFKRYGVVGISIVIVSLLLIFVSSEIKNIVTPQNYSIVILPFESSGQHFDTLKTGSFLSAILAMELSKYPQFKVISPTSVSSNSVNRNSNEIVADEFKVNYVISGKISGEKENLVLDFRMFKRKAGAVVLNEKINGRLIDISSLIEKTLEQIVKSLGENVDSRSVTYFSRNENALNAFSNGMWYSNSRSKEDLELGIRYLRKSVALDTTFALAHSQLAASLHKKFRLSGEEEKTLLRESQESSFRALRHDPRNGIAYTALGTLYRYRQRWDEALATLLKALEFAPGNGETHRQLALFFSISGDDAKALKHASNSIELDPKNMESYEVFGIVNQMAGKFTEANSAYYKAITLGSSDSLLSTRYRYSSLSLDGLGIEAVTHAQTMLSRNSKDLRLYYFAGRQYQLSGQASESMKYLESGLSFVRQQIETDGTDASLRAYQALFLSRLGKFKEAEQEMKKASELEPTSTAILYRRANLFAIQGKNDDALEFLKQAVNAEFIFSEVLGADLTFLMKDPRYRQTIIPSAFQKSGN